MCNMSTLENLICNMDSPGSQEVLWDYCLERSMATPHSYVMSPRSIDSGSSATGSHYIYGYSRVNHPKMGGTWCSMSQNNCNFSESAGHESDTGWETR